MPASLNHFVPDYKAKNKVVFAVTCMENGSVGRDFFFFLNSKQLKWHILALSLCLTSINFVFIKEKESSNY